jgi:hypothetical protein
MSKNAAQLAHMLVTTHQGATQLQVERLADLTPQQREDVLTEDMRRVITSDADLLTKAVKCLVLAKAIDENTPSATDVNMARKMISMFDKHANVSQKPVLEAINDAINAVEPEPSTPRL